MEQELQSRVNFYELLGIDRQASHAEVKRAYRSLVKQYHPDVSDKPDTVKNFQLIQKAYEILSDPQKRAIYDELLYRRENGMANPYINQTQSRTFRQRAYRNHTAPPQEAPETLGDKFQFHLKQVIGVVIVTSLAVIGIGLMALGTFFLFIGEFNGAMVAGYASLGGGIGILLNTIKAYKVIGNLWINWFQNHS
jgi:hypothetical protein